MGLPMLSLKEACELRILPLGFRSRCSELAAGDYHLRPVGPRNDNADFLVLAYFDSEHRLLHGFLQRGAMRVHDTTDARRCFFASIVV
jgi:hypothetical protein